MDSSMGSSNLKRAVDNVTQIGMFYAARISSDVNNDCQIVLERTQQIVNDLVTLCGELLRKQGRTLPREHPQLASEPVQHEQELELEKVKKFHQYLGKLMFLFTSFKESVMPRSAESQIQSVVSSLYVVNDAVQQILSKSALEGHRRDLIDQEQESLQPLGETVADPSFEEDGQEVGFTEETVCRNPEIPQESASSMGYLEEAEDGLPQDEGVVEGYSQEEEPHLPEFPVDHEYDSPEEESDLLEDTAVYHDEGPVRPESGGGTDYDLPEEERDPLVPPLAQERWSDVEESPLPESAPGTLALAASSRNPILENRGGVSSLSPAAKQAITEFLSANDRALDGQKRRKLDLNVIRWIKATPPGMMLMLKISPRQVEPIPRYIPDKNKE